MAKSRIQLEPAGVQTYSFTLLNSIKATIYAFVLSQDLKNLGSEKDGKFFLEISTSVNSTRGPTLHQICRIYSLQSITPAPQIFPRGSLAHRCAKLPYPPRSEQVAEKSAPTRSRYDASQERDGTLFLKISYYKCHYKSTMPQLEILFAP